MFIPLLLLCIARAFAFELVFITSALPLIVTAPPLIVPELLITLALVAVPPLMVTAPFIATPVFAMTMPPAMLVVVALMAKPLLVFVTLPPVIVTLAVLIVLLAPFPVTLPPFIMTAAAPSTWELLMATPVLEVTLPLIIVMIAFGDECCMDSDATDSRTDRAATYRNMGRIRAAAGDVDYVTVPSLRY
jgi:hypothetical protein